MRANIPLLNIFNNGHLNQIGQFEINSRNDQIGWRGCFYIKIYCYICMNFRCYDTMFSQPSYLYNIPFLLKHGPDLLIEFLRPLVNITFMHRCNQLHSSLTLHIRGPSYPCLNRSISWLLMLWFLVSSSHQQQWHWLYRIERSLSCMHAGFKLHVFCYCKYMFIFLKKNWARKGLSTKSYVLLWAQFDISVSICL